jgi:hypothetical protein
MLARELPKKRRPTEVSALIIGSGGAIGRHNSDLKVDIGLHCGCRRHPQIDHARAKMTPQQGRIFPRQATSTAIPPDWAELRLGASQPIPFRASTKPRHATKPSKSVTWESHPSWSTTMTASHYINETKSDMRGIKPGWYAIEDDGELSSGPFSSLAECVKRITQPTNATMAV